MKDQLNIFPPQTPVQTVYEFHGLLKATDVAEILGVSKSMAYKLMQLGKIPRVRIGYSIRVHPADLAHYINDNTENPNS